MKKWDNWFEGLIQQRDKYCVGDDTMKMAAIRELVVGSGLNAWACKLHLREAVDEVRGEMAKVAGSESSDDE